MKRNIAKKNMLYYERKENQVLVMAFTRRVRGDVTLLQQYSRTRTFLFFNFKTKENEQVMMEELNNAEN